MAKLKEREILERLDECFDLITSPKVFERLWRLKQAFGRLSPEDREMYLNEINALKEMLEALYELYLVQDLRAGVEALRAINRKHDESN